MYAKAYIQPPSAHTEIFWENHVITMHDCCCPGSLRSDAVDYEGLTCVHTIFTHLLLDKMDAISQTIFSDVHVFSWMKKNCILIKISFKFVHKGLISNNPALVQIMAWRRTSNEPLPEPMLPDSLTHTYMRHLAEMSFNQAWPLHFEQKF